MARANKLKRSQKPTPSTVRLRRSPDSIQAEEPLKSVDELRKSRVGEFFLMHSTLIEIGKRALADCVALHEQCRPTTSTSSAYFLPTRLIDLESLERPKLIDSKAIIGEDQRYACLSHQWGKPDQDTKRAMTTTCDNFQARMDGIDFWALPERYRESILICKSFGIRYMWIDSLCIIQDCPEDWRTESGMMAQVYENGILTISSNLPVDGQAWKPPLPAKTPYPVIRDNGEEWFTAMLLHGPLASRAWCLQERYLSPRILHIFERNLWIWECSTRVRGAHKNGLLYRRDVTEHQDRPWRKQLMDARLDHSTLLDLWYNAASDYSNRSLTYDTDKLPAISGIAAKLQTILNYKYLAGLWQEDIIHGLLWHNGSNPMRLDVWPWVYDSAFKEEMESLPALKVPSSYIAPSWSWASFQGPVEFMRLGASNFTPLATLKSSSIETLGDTSKRLGEVGQRSHIVLCGHFCDPIPRLQAAHPSIALVMLDGRIALGLEELHYFVIGMIDRKMFKTQERCKWLGLILHSSDPGTNIYSRVGIFSFSVYMADDMSHLYAGTMAEITIV